MPFDDLTQFLQAASDAGELERVGVELSPREEIAAVTQEICREFRDQSPLILFEHPSRSSMPVATNLLGHRQRFLRATGASDLDELIARLQAALNPFPAGRDWKFGLGGGPTLDRGRFLPRVIRRGACQQVIKLGKDLDLGELPLLQSWNGETHPAITSGLVITESPDGRPSVELVPAAMLDRETLALHWQPSHVGGTLWRQARLENRPFPVAIALGGDPLLGYVASLPLPRPLEPWVFAGMLRNESVNLIRARSVELNVPADAEIILEGYIDPAAGSASGCVAGPDGLLVARSQLPVLRLSAITHRANPIFPARVQGFDFQEEAVTGLLTERLLLSMLKLINPHAVDLHLPACGNHRQVLFVGSNCDDPSVVRQLLQAAGSLPLASAAGIFVAVGPQVDLRATDAVWREVALSVSGSGRGDSALSLNVSQQSTGQLFIDATRTGAAGGLARASEEVLARIAERLGSTSWDAAADAVLAPPV
ncbi:UbiD family decarboxylase [Planctomicrobium piriforme]|uniref:4-hydroxy-3-polyprenylbenzoate decarboxylase n=1 Tax=Planctomicrobium piriforme TaxID=1576369 RepID=A0A1I3BF84_9PLAN|nr:UbiD family decarboxylase [Planctomicrobium piriforme]SFH60810.1 4-hydroxy-3-polyprenylbenzoate decarboxylase [Planctomicrobium piriforme]